MKFDARLRGAIVLAAIATGAFIACDSATNRHGGGGAAGGTGGGAAGGTGGGGAGGTGGTGGTGGSGGTTGDPTTCADAAAQKSYVGCDYWPTVTPNPVWSDFDFAVVVANTGTNTAMVTVTGPNNVNQMTTVAPGQLAKVYLPWVPMLKGDDNNCGSPIPLSASTLMAKGAYHLVSSVPVVVYQFNALEYGPKGGPAGKDWSACMQKASACGGGLSCFSYSNDASLLLPSTALTSNYRVTGWHTGAGYGAGGYMAITGLQDATTVTVKLAAKSKVLAGTNVAAISGGATGTYMLNQGDVLELISRDTSLIPSDVDPTGTLIKADKPIQVVAGDHCANNPQGAQACDHVEESVFPAETLGKHYLVSRPAGPRGDVVGQTVRLVGNVDGTNLTFNPAVSGAPATINAGQVVEIAPSTMTDFEVTGDHEFAVETMQQGGSVVDPNTAVSMQEGDPSQSLVFAVEQYRTGYLFLAPDDYDFTFVVITGPAGAHLMLDGSAVSTAPAMINSSYATWRVPIMTSGGGQHTISSDMPIGIQVLGYGQYTSYQYPGGGNLAAIAPPPIQ